MSVGAAHADAQSMVEPSTSDTAAEMPRPELDAPRRPDVPSAGTLLRTTPLAVWLLVALAGAITMLSAVFYPNFRGPDEPEHVDLAVSMAARNVNWRIGEAPLHKGVDRAPFVPRTRLKGAVHLGKDSAPPRSQRKSFDALGGMAPAVPALNYIVQHPPLYYMVLGSALSVVPHWQTMPFDRVVMFLRLVSALLILPVPWFCFAAARTMGAGKGVSIAAAAVPLMIPQLMRISATVNNDALVTVLGAAAVYLATGVYRGDLSRRRAGQLGVVCAALLLTKAIGLIVTLLVAVIYLISFARHRRFEGVRRPFVRCAVWFAAPVLLASTWWLGNLVKYRTLQPDGTAPLRRPGAFTPHTTFAKTGMTYVRSWLDDFTQRFWFDDPTGTQRTAALHAIALAATLLVIALFVAVLVRPLVDRLFSVLILGTMAVAVGQLLHNGWAPWAAGRAIAGAQGRYIFGLISGLAVLIAFGLRVVIPGPERWVARVAVTLAVALNIVGALDTIRYYWYPKPGTGNTVWHTLQNFYYISALPPWLLTPLIVVVVLLTTATLFAVWLPGRPHRWLGRAGAIDAVDEPGPAGREAPVPA